MRHPVQDAVSSKDNFFFICRWDELWTTRLLLRSRDCLEEKKRKTKRMQSSEFRGLPHDQRATLSLCLPLPLIICYIKMKSTTWWSFCVLSFMTRGYYLFRVLTSSVAQRTHTMAGSVMVEAALRLCLAFRWIWIRSCYRFQGWRSTMILSSAWMANSSVQTGPYYWST